MITINRILQRTQFLYSLSVEEWLVYRLGGFYVYHIHKNKYVHICNFKPSLKYKIIGRSAILSRMLRQNIRYTLQMEADVFLVVAHGSFYSLNIRRKTLVVVGKVQKGSHPLQINKIENVEGFVDGVYYGEYFNNPLKKEVSILMLDNNFQSNVVYTFKAGEINHIHSLVADKTNKCVWILTGDFGNAAAMWRATQNFSQIEKIIESSQQNRGCIAFPYNKGLLYATDSPLEDNHIYYLYQDNNIWHKIRLADINGSCIYGCKYNDVYIFATAVEGSGTETSFLKSLCNTKRGPGIKDDFAYIYIMSHSGDIRMVYKAKKDIIPFVLGQFGTFQFPQLMISGEYLPVFSVGLTRYDMSTMLFGVSERSNQV